MRTPPEFPTPTHDDGPQWDAVAGEIDGIREKLDDLIREDARNLALEELQRRARESGSRTPNEPTP